MTGALSAFWLDPSANARAVAPVEQEPVEARRWFAQSLRPRAVIRPRELPLEPRRIL
jgi:hypothetical protein